MGMIQWAVLWLGNISHQMMPIIWKPPCCDFVLVPVRFRAANHAVIELGVGLDFCVLISEQLLLLSFSLSL